MRGGDFGWHYPPGVTGNEPQIAGPSDTDCLVCGDPAVDEPDGYDDPGGPHSSAPDGSGVFCSARCEALWTVENGATARAQLDAALELEDVTVRVHRAAAAPIEGVVIGRHTALPSFTLEDDEGEVDVLAGMIERVEVVE